jgi:hypothetical protein
LLPTIETGFYIQAAAAATARIFAVAMANEDLPIATRINAATAALPYTNHRPGV